MWAGYVFYIPFHSLLYTLSVLMLVLKICDFLYTLAIFRSFPFIISNTYITPMTTFYRQAQAFP